MPDSPERIWLQTNGTHWHGCTWADHEIDESDTEYVRADLHPTNAAMAVCETLLHLYGPDGQWFGDKAEAAGEAPYSRLWWMLQVVTQAPRSPSERWAPYEALMRECACRLTGCTMDEVTEPLSLLLHQLRHPAREEVPGMVVTDLGAWEGEDGG